MQIFLEPFLFKLASQVIYVVHFFPHQRAAELILMYLDNLRTARRQELCYIKLQNYSVVLVALLVTSSDKNRIFCNVVTEPETSTRPSVIDAEKFRMYLSQSVKLFSKTAKASYKNNKLSELKKIH